MKLSNGQLAALSRLFSSAVFHELAKRGKSGLFARLVRQVDFLVDRQEGFSVGDLFDAAFSILKRSGLRDEYIYRAALTHNVLLGKHSLNTASMLTEFRTGSSKADLIILNGTGTVYEIKSERDSLCRLNNQVANYQKVFSKVYVITSDFHTKSIISECQLDVGIMCLTSRGHIRVLREATSKFETVCPLVIFDSLRLNEAKEILSAFDIVIPEVPNTMVRSVMKERFAKLDPEETHRQMVTTLKRTRNLAPLAALVAELPRSLQPAALSVRLQPVDHSRLLVAVRTPLNLAMKWV